MKISNIVLIFALLILATNNSFSQQLRTLKGYVVNSEGTPMMGNAIVLSVSDSSLITGASFLEGYFEIPQITTENFLLKLQSLEFQDKYIPMNLRNDSSVFDLGRIEVSQQGSLLDEVVVRSSIPLFETSLDGATQVNVANTILSTSTSVNEILSKSPGVMVDEETVSVLGKGEAIIYLNGQRIQIEQLNLIQASEIKTIEVISNPSAKFDAQGQAVINIITNGPGLEGFKGTINQNVTISDFAKPVYITNLSLDYRKDRFTAKANYGIEVGAQRFILNTTRKRDEPNDFFESNITTDWQRDIENYSNYGLGLQYDLGNDSYISLAYNGMTFGFGGTESSRNKILINESRENYQSTVFKDDLTQQHGLTFNYFIPVDNNGSSLFIGGQYIDYQSGKDDYIEEQSLVSETINERELQNVVDRTIPVISTKIDYTHALNEKAKLEVGLKFGAVTNKSNSIFLVSENMGAFVPDPQLSRDYAYDEEIYAGYFNYSNKVSDQLSFSAGIRSEYTRYDLDTDQLNSPLESEYFNIFPNVSANYILNENISVFSSLSSRIYRPSYQSLNPSLIYQDAFTSIQGNPNLIPTKIYALEAGALVGGITLKAGYSYERDDLAGGAVQGDSPRSYILTSLNVKSGEQFFLSGMLPYSNDWWTSSNTINLSYNKYTTEDDLYGFMPSKPVAYLYTNNKFNLFSGLKLQLLAWYRSDSQDAIYFRKSQSELTVGLEKSFFSKSLKMQVTANDIFHTNKPDGYYNLGETFILFDRINNTQNFRFSLTYNFGKLKRSNFKNKATGDEESNRL